MRIILSNFPFPPSVNASRGSFFNKAKGKMIHYNTNQHKAFKKEVEAYGWQHSLTIRRVEKKLKDLLSNHQYGLKVDLYFCYPSNSIWNQSGTIKKEDVKNRIKALEDALSNLIGIDDKYFTSGNCEKCFVNRDQNPSVTIVLSPHQILSYDSICAELGIQTEDEKNSGPGLTFQSP